MAVSKYINPACQVNMGGHITRPFFQPKSSPISRSMKPRRSQSHIPNCTSCCSKSSAADTQWETPDMCVRCFGCLHLVQVAVCFGQTSLTHFLDLGWWVRKCFLADMNTATIFIRTHCQFGNRPRGDSEKPRRSTKRNLAHVKRKVATALSMK